ncbi:MAG: sigma-70 family RNA polymerase sigma factor [Phycisphaerales bacterium]|nr:sigma-70 family RNA polymerase sigma factor [Phycisphaerales bacterium]
MSVDPREWTDDRLAEGLRTQRGECVSELTRRYWPPIQRFCANFLCDHQLGEDVAQETFLRLTDETPPPLGRVRPWLYRIARNRCLDLLRRQKISPTHNHPLRTGIDPAATRTGVSGAMRRDERDERLHLAIDGLPQEYREVLLLKYFEGMDREEMAVALDATPQAVKGRLTRASDALQEALRGLSGSAG